MTRRLLLYGVLLYYVATVSMLYCLLKYRELYILTVVKVVLVRKTLYSGLNTVEKIYKYNNMYLKVFSVYKYKIWVNRFFLYFGYTWHRP